MAITSGTRTDSLIGSTFALSAERYDMFKDRSINTRMFRSDDEVGCILAGIILCLLPVLVPLWAVGWIALKISEEV